MGSGKILVDETAVASADDAGWLRRHVAALPRPLRFLCVGAAGLTTDLIVFTAIPLHAQHPLAARIVSLAAATFVTWRLNRELTFERSGRSQHREALRYGAVTAISQGASFIVFSSLVMTALAHMPQLALLAGAGAGAAIAYSGHALFAFRPLARGDTDGGPST
jgi:putative flippase GtrA